MIEVRARADFKADFPDDGVENESGYLLFPGRAVTAAIAEVFRGIGCEVSDPIHADEHGWELDIEFKTETIWCQVTSIDVGENILLLTDGPFMGNYSDKPGYLEAIAKLDLAMKSDPRFHDLRWCRWRDPEGPAANAPLDVDPEQLPKRPARRGLFGWGAGQPAANRQGARPRNRAKMVADFPDDTVQVDGKIVQWAGKGAAVAIAQILGQIGANVSEPINVEPRWELDIRLEGQAAKVQIEAGDGIVYLDIDDRLVVDRPAYIDLLVDLNARMHRDPRFHDIRWYRRDEISVRGLSSNSPLGPTP